MQKHFLKISILSFFVLAFSLTASSQIYVSVRPVVPVIVRPVQPSPAHIWIDEEWEARGGAYVYAGGHWAAPPHPGMYWVGGHWNHHDRYGEQWVPGHWRRR
jgi:hypothetical protein